MASDAAEEGAPGGDDAARQVLLYYCYAPLAGRERDVARWYERDCGARGLVGRVRVAADGANATLRGSERQLRAHQRALGRAEALGTAAAGVDFKYGPGEAADGADGALAAQCGVDALHVRVTGELVTLGPRAARATVADAGEHLSAQEWHALANAGTAADTVLIDVRNAYESAIGRFEVPAAKARASAGGDAGVGAEAGAGAGPGDTPAATAAVERPPPTLTPQIRQMSDFAQWAEDNERALRGKRCLMYCTGGVRCERASAYLRKELGVLDCYQLSGGVHRYLDAYGTRGLFRGKLFVYDDRLATDYGTTLGGGEHCGRGSGGGTSEAVGECLGCGAPCSDYAVGGRQRCGKCRMLVVACAACSGARAAAADQAGRQWECALCAAAAAERARAPPPPQRRLRVLCLHGFRQTGKQLRGRLAKLRGKLGDLVDFKFADAPHLLLSPREWNERQRARRRLECADEQGDPKDEGHSAPAPAAPRRAWLVGREDHERLYGPVRASGERGAGAGAEGGAEAAAAAATVWAAQRYGWEQSLARLDEVTAAAGPFDGVLGFSQGAAVAAALASRRPESFSFVVLASGFESPAAPVVADSADGAVSAVPSLHIYGDGSAEGDVGYGGADGARVAREAEALAARFDAASRVVVRHRCGHIMPTDKEALVVYRKFLLGQAAATASS